jgi:hypothetical protein
VRRAGGRRACVVRAGGRESGEQQERERAKVVKRAEGRGSRERERTKRNEMNANFVINTARFI